MTGPWSFDAARENCAAASKLQEAAEKAVCDAARSAAEAEERYRLALAREIVRQHDEEGRAWSVCQDVARGNRDVAALRRERDIAEGVRESVVQAVWRRAADRKDAQRFADWSQRREMADGYVS